MNNRIYHNPRCSKSRQTLKLMDENNTDVEIIEYLKNPPSAVEISILCSQIGISPKELVRLKEPVLKELGLSAKSELTDDKWCKIMSENPKLIERPIVVYNGKVVLGRPPEKVLEII